MNRVFWTALTVALALVGLSSCGGDSGSTTQDTSGSNDSQVQEDQWIAPDLAPVPPECTPQFSSVCTNSAVYWVDGCGNQGELITACECGCAAGDLDCLVCNCVPDCTGKACGDDGCGGQCQPGCEPGFSCDAGTGQCVGCAPQCEGRVCGYDMCSGECAPGCDVGQSCDQGTGQCLTPCYPACEGKQCGDNGCGGSCGTCPDGGSCGADFQCPVTGCTCVGKSCGDDGCGTSCGTCGGGMTCNTSTHQCEGSCQGTCNGKECGDNGCGTSCGSCPIGAQCGPDNLCVSSCVPQCDGKSCGSNGCGGICAPGCPSGQTCNEAGTACEQTCGNGVLDQGELCESTLLPPQGVPCAQFLMGGDGSVECDPYSCEPVINGCTCDTAPAVCGVLQAEAGCLTCAAKTLCFEEYKACQVDPLCADWRGCISACDSAYCVDNCTDLIGFLPTTAQDLKHCFMCECKMSCGFEQVNCM